MSQSDRNKKSLTNRQSNWDKPLIDVAAEVAAEDQEQKHNFLVMLEELSGNTPKALRALGISRRTMNAWDMRDPDFREKRQELAAGLNSEMEDVFLSVARDATQKGNTRIAAAKNFLEGNDDRYRKKQETNNHTGNITINLIIDEPETAAPTTFTIDEPDSGTS